MSARRSGAIRKLKKAVRRSGESADKDEADEDEEDWQAPKAGEDGMGHFQDGDGRRLEGLIRLYVKHVETPRSADPEHRFLGIEGTMLSPGEENTSSGVGHLTNGSIFGGDAR